MALVKQGDSTWSSCLSCIQVSYRCSRYSKNSLFHSWQNSWSIRSFCLACKVKRKLNDRFPLLSASHMLFHFKKKLSHWFLEFPRAKQLFPILQTYCFAKKKIATLYIISWKKPVLNRLLKDKNDLLVLRLCYTTSSYMGEGEQGLLLEKTNLLKQNDNEYTIKTFSLKIFDSP